MTLFPTAVRSVRYVLGALLTLALAALVVGLTWYVTEHVIAAQRRETIQRGNVLVSSLAATYAEQINRHILALDQTLDIMVKEWEADPRRFSLEAWRSRSTVLAGISRDMFLTDENGVIRQCSVPEFIGQTVGELDVFRDSAEHANDKPQLYLGAATINPIMRQWHLDAARTLHHPDGSFAGIIDADYRVSAITDVFEAAAPGSSGFAALISLSDGKLRATFGSDADSPDSSIADTPLFAAVDAADSGLWTGPSATDAANRQHGFRHLPGRDLAVIAGLDEKDVLRPVVTWATQTRAFAIGITGLVAIVAFLALNALYGARRRAVIARENQAQLAAAHALAEVSRAQADATSRQLQATFDAVHDGIAIFDAHLNLVEWNPLFPDRTGVNPSYLRTGMPMEDVLRLQAEAGYFGTVPDVADEVERRTALLRAGNFGDSQRFRVDGRIVELHCQPLAEGGFVAIYTDVTEGTQAREAVRDAAAALARESSNRLRFLGVIGHELRARVAFLLQSIGVLRATSLSPDQTRAADRILRAGEMLSGLAADVVEMSAMEAGTLALHPAMVNVRPLLQDIVDTFQPAAADRGIIVYLIVNDATPEELIADPNRIRQVLTLLLSEALRHAAPNAMWLLAETGEDDRGEKASLLLTIRAFGTPIPEDVRAGMFRSFDSIAAPAETAARGTGLGLAIARHLATLMDGAVGCAPWSTLDGRTGNDFLMSLPPGLLPDQQRSGQGASSARQWPRTRVLMVGAATGLQLAAATMLRRDGHMVDAAPNGGAAVRALNRAPYDIVFIDAVLQDMNVESAARYIRHLPGPARTVPVIALAPSHSDTDAQAWRGVGVDDILTAPPSFPDLIDAISRHVWLGGSSGGALPAPVEQEWPTEDGVPILSAARIRELRSNIPHEQLVEMVEECISDLIHRLPALRRSLSARAPNAISAQAHAMVGMAGGYGMAVLEARLRLILNAARDNRLDTIDNAAAVVEADLTRAAAALRQAIGHNEPAQ